MFLPLIYKTAPYGFLITCQNYIDICNNCDLHTKCRQLNYYSCLVYLYTCLLFIPILQHSCLHLYRFTELEIKNGKCAGQWHIWGHILPQDAPYTH